MELVGKFLRTADNAHAAAPAPGRRLDNNGKADAACPLLGFVGRCDDAFRPRQIRPSTFFLVAGAFSLSPINRGTSCGGPINLIPDSRQTSAKLAFSLNRP